MRKIKRKFLRDYSNLGYVILNFVAIDTFKILLLNISSGLKVTIIFRLFAERSCQKSVRNNFTTSLCKNWILLKRVVFKMDDARNILLEIFLSN